MPDLYDFEGCDRCAMRRWCRGREVCDRMLESAVEDDRDEWYEAWFEYIGQYAD